MYYTDIKRTALSNNIRDPYATRLINWYPEGYMPKEILGTSEDLIMDSPKNSYLVSPTSTTTNSMPRIQSKTIIRPLKGWEIIAEYTYNQNSYKYRNYSGILRYADVQLAVKTTPTDPTRDLYTINSYTTKYNALNLYTNYKLSLGKHAMTAMVGFNQESYDYSGVNASIEGQSVPTVPSFGGGTGIKNISDNYSEYSIRGMFARLTYNYADRYLLTVNARYDGSSNSRRKTVSAFSLPFLSAGALARRSSWTGLTTGLMSSNSGLPMAPSVTRTSIRTASSLPWASTKEPTGLTTTIRQSISPHLA